MASASAQLFKDELYRRIRHTPGLAHLYQRAGQGDIVVEAYLDGKARADLTDEVLLDMSVDTGVVANFPEEARGMLESIANQSNGIVAGGYLLNQLVWYTPDKCDIDVFLTGPQPPAFAIHPPDVTQVTTLGNSIVELRLPNRSWHIQMIYASDQKSPLQVVSDFDIDACKVFLRHGRIWLMPDAFMAIATRTIRNIRFDVLSLTPEFIVGRLRKMVTKGFVLGNGIKLPELEAEPTIMPADQPVPPVQYEEKSFQLQMQSLKPMKRVIVYGEKVESERFVCVSEVDYQLPANLSLALTDSDAKHKCPFRFLRFKDIPGVLFSTPVAPIYFVHANRLMIEMPLEPSGISQRFKGFCEALCIALTLSLGSSVGNSFWRTVERDLKPYIQLFVDIPVHTSRWWLRNSPMETYNAENLSAFAKGRNLRGRLHIALDGVSQFNQLPYAHQHIELQGIELEEPVEQPISLEVMLQQMKLC